MSFLSCFSESTGSVSSSARAESRISEGSSDLSEEVLGSGHAKFYEQPNMTGMLPSKLAESNLPHRCYLLGRFLLLPTTLHLLRRRVITTRLEERRRARKARIGLVMRNSCRSFTIE